MYVSDHNSKQPIPDEWEEIRRQLCQSTDELIGRLQRLRQMLEGSQPPDGDGLACLLPLLNALQQMSATPKHNRLPTLQTHAMQAYYLRETFGMKQTEIARQLNAEHHTTYGQGHVSKLLKRADAYVKAVGLPATFPPAATSVAFVDPNRLDLGRRTGGRRADEDRSEWRPDDE